MRFETGSSGAFSTVIRRSSCPSTSYTGAVVATDEYGASRRATAKVTGRACPRPPPSDGGGSNGGGGSCSYCHGYGKTLMYQGVSCATARRVYLSYAIGGSESRGWACVSQGSGDGVCEGPDGREVSWYTG